MLRRWFSRRREWQSAPASHAGESPSAAQLALTGRVDDSAGWSPGVFPSGSSGLSYARPLDYDPARVQELYQDALAAWRKNPIAWRIVAITTDYVVGDHLRISSPQRELERFIQRFWYHPKNRMDLRLEAMCDELGRSGDLFVLLFRNPHDGMSYIRFVTKDCLLGIETAENDWESELAYHVRNPDSGSLQGQRWLSPAHPEAPQAEAVLLHYAVNRPLGALLGESDLTTLLPWLQRYSRMLEDRVRLHWALRAFLWMVTVPVNKVREKQEQYRTPPEAGSIIVKDESETWQAVNPQVGSADAQHDLRAVRGMIDAGSGYPPHWRGEAADANLATATAMQAPTERHLLRRQQYFTFILQDILYHAYQRAVESGQARPLSGRGGQPGAYSELFSVVTPDISRSDNEALARAAQAIASGLASLQAQLPRPSASLQQRAIELFMKFAGEPHSSEAIAQISAESGLMEQVR